MLLSEVVELAAAEATRWAASWLVGGANSSGGARLARASARLLSSTTTRARLMRMTRGKKISPDRDSNSDYWIQSPG